jgi:hypothetical protein
MKPGIYCVILTAAWLVVMTAAGNAQSSDVTFQVPVNLTRLSADLTKVAVYCEITSAALPRVASLSVGRAQKQVELTPSGGQLVQTVSVVVPISSLDTSNGKTSADYKCTLSGFSQSLQRWSLFEDSQTVPAVFRLSPTPPSISANFTW